MNDICRVCLTPTVSKKHSNLFYATGRSTQLWAKIMACAWVQHTLPDPNNLARWSYAEDSSCPVVAIPLVPGCKVALDQGRYTYHHDKVLAVIREVFEGDGLPGQICYKCHNKLDIAYHFKQQCEAADAQLRQFIARNIPSKSNAHPNIEIPQDQRDCLLDRKPINLNIPNECDLTLNALRLLNQELPFLQNIDLRIAEIDLNAAKQEPGALITSGTLENVDKTTCDLNTAFKSETFNDNEPLFNGIAAKLFESVQYALPPVLDSVENIDSKGAIWDLQNKSSPVPELSIANESNDKADETNLSFLDDASAGCSSLLSTRNLVIGTPPVENENETQDAVCLKITKDPLESVKEKSDDAILPVLNNINCDEKSKKGKNAQEQCELCGKIFKYKGYMQQHLRTHSDLKPFSCDECNEKFSMLHSLVSHRRIHTGEKPYICATCGKRFTQSSSLKAHTRLHTGEKPFKCDICSRQFNQKSNLQTHKISHSGQRQYTCKTCNKAFKCQKNLHSHQKLHDNIKQFKCSICLKSFQRKSYLRTHLNIHSGKKPHRCKECGHAFSNASNLTSHMRTHTGVKPYNCNVCKKAFAQSNALGRHMQKHEMQ